MKKSTKIFRTVCLALVSLSMLSAGFAKLTHNAAEVTLFNTVHLDSVLMIIGVLEVLLALGLWWKKTRTLSLLLVTATMGAALAETISASAGVNAEIIAPGIILLLAWTVFFIDRA